MSNHNNYIRYTRPNGYERPGPRFNNRGGSHNPFRPQMSNTSPSAAQPPKPPTEVTTVAASVPTTSTEQNPNESQTTVTTDTSSKGTETTTNMTKSEPTPTVKPQTEQASVETKTGQKRPLPGDSSTQPVASTSQKNNQGGRSRLFIGNIPTDLTKEEFFAIFSKYGELVEHYVNPSRGFGFVKLTSRHQAERAKYDLDGYLLRGKALRVRFASQGAIVRVKNLSPYVSNELLKDAFENYFGTVERAVVLVDDRGKSIGEGIVEFQKKPSAQKCLNECTEGCFFITGTLKPIIVEPWDIKDEEDGLPEKSLIRDETYYKERELKPRFADMNSFEQTIGLKWKELELQEKQLLEEVKRRMQYASDQLQAEIDQIFLDHQANVLREELTRRQEDLRRIDERRQMIPMHHPDAYTGPIAPFYQANPVGPMSTAHPGYNNDTNPYLAPGPVPSSMAPPIDAAYTTHQVAAHAYDYNPQTQGFHRKRARH